VTSPGSFEDVVYLLRPELVKRGLMWEDYDVPGGTLRENLYGVEGQNHLRDDHYGHKFKYPSEFAGDTLANEAAKNEDANGVCTEVKRNGVEVPVKNGQVTVTEEAVPVKSE
jgi:hypothetical protein